MTNFYDNSKVALMYSFDGITAIKALQFLVLTDTAEKNFIISLFSLF